MAEKEKISAATIAALRITAGQSETRRRNAARIFERIPENGTFVEPIVKEFELEDESGETRIVKSVGYTTTDGDFVSESALIKSNILPELVQIRTGERKGRYMLRMQRLTDLRKFGKSQDEQLANLAGRSFTTKPVEIRVYKAQYLSSPEAFDEVTIDAGAVTPESEETVKKGLLSCTEAATGYEFIIK
jgi:hypothetical protein